MAIGGALGGWVDGFFDSQTVFLLGALLAMLWLLVASTMSEPPYVSSLRVEVPDGVVVDSALQARLLSASGFIRRWWYPRSVRCISKSTARSPTASR